MGVRPMIYSGYGMWPGIMGANNTTFKAAAVGHQRG